MAHYDDEEARRLFAAYAQTSKKELALPEVAQGALREILRQLLSLAQKFGLTAQPLNESEGEGIEISGKEEKAAIVALEGSQLVVYTPYTNNKDKELSRSPGTRSSIDSRGSRTIRAAASPAIARASAARWRWSRKRS